MQIIPLIIQMCDVMCDSQPITDPDEFCVGIFFYKKMVFMYICVQNCLTHTAVKCFSKFNIYLVYNRIK